MRRTVTGEGMGMVRDELRAIVERLPEDATWNDVMNEVARRANLDRPRAPFARGERDASERERSCVRR